VAGASGGLPVGRRVALGALLGAAGLLWPGTRAGAAGSGAASADLAGLLRGLVKDGPAARALGRAYLAGGRVEASTLRARLDALAAAAPRDAAGLREAVRAASARDLAAGDVAVVDGWVLARTEAEILALVALA
jgi:hypothetical protein